MAENIKRLVSAKSEGLDSCVAVLLLFEYLHGWLRGFGLWAILAVVILRPKAHQARTTAAPATRQQPTTTHDPTFRYIE